MRGGNAVAAEPLRHRLGDFDAAEIADRLFAVGEPPVLLEHVAVDGLDIVLKIRVDLALVVIAAADVEFRQLHRRRIVIIRRQIAVFDKPFRGDALDQNVVDVLQSDAAHALWRCRHADALHVREPVIDFLIGFGEAVMILVGDDQIWRFRAVEPTRDGLHHLDFAQRQIDAPAEKGVIDLFAQLAPMYQKQDVLAHVREALGNFRCDDGFTAAAWQHDTRRTVTRGVGGEQLMQQIPLIRSQLHQNSRSSSAETACAG